jgi:hypothetical protein
VSTDKGDMALALALELELELTMGLTVVVIAKMGKERWQTFNMKFKLRPGRIRDESKFLTMSSWEVVSGGVPACVAEEGAARRIFNELTTIR